MGRHVRGRQAGHAAGGSAGVLPAPLLGAGREDRTWRATEARRPAAAAEVTTHVLPLPRPGRAAPSPGSATVTLPDGTSFQTQPGQQYAVPVGSRMTLPSRITMRLDRPGPVLNIEDRSRIHVTPPEDVPAA
jgi:hypothetical protein